MSFLSSILIKNQRREEDKEINVLLKDLIDGQNINVKEQEEDCNVLLGLCVFVLALGSAIFVVLAAAALLRSLMRRHGLSDHR